MNWYTTVFIKLTLEHVKKKLHEAHCDMLPECNMYRKSRSVHLSLVLLMTVARQTTRKICKGRHMETCSQSLPLLPNTAHKTLTSELRSVTIPRLIDCRSLQNTRKNSRNSEWWLNIEPTKGVMNARTCSLLAQTMEWKEERIVDSRAYFPFTGRDGSVLELRCCQFYSHNADYYIGILNFQLNSASRI